MPYKDKKKAYEAYKRWVKRNPEKSKNANSIGDVARRYNKERKVCLVAGCKTIGERHHPDYSKPKEIIWLCKKHHEEIHHGDMTCVIEGCGKKKMAKDRCNQHYKQYRKETVPEYALRVKVIRRNYYVEMGK